MKYFESDRLIFRDWEKSDLELFINMNKDSDVMKYFPNKLTSEESINFYQKIVDEFKKEGFGLYAVEYKEDNQFIGFIGFHKANFEADFTPCIEIGWRLRKEYWNKGLATEGAKACLYYGFNQLNLKEIYSFTSKINTPSENVMKKIGMKKLKEFDHPKVDSSSPLCKHVLYYIKAH